MSSPLSSSGPPGPGDRLAEIRQREQAATKGPWEIAPRSSSDEIANVVSEYQVVPGGARANWIAELDAGIDFDNDREGQIEGMVANAEFIAHAREDVPYLLAELTAKDTQIAQLRSDLDALHGMAAAEREEWQRDNAALQARLNSPRPFGLPQNPQNP